MMIIKVNDNIKFLTMKQYLCIFSFLFLSGIVFSQQPNSVNDPNVGSFDGITQYQSSSPNSWDGAGVSPVEIGRAHV